MANRDLPLVRRAGLVGLTNLTYLASFEHKQAVMAAIPNADLLHNLFKDPDATVRDVPRHSSLHIYTIQSACLVAALKRSASRKQDILQKQCSKVAVVQKE